ncbi:hypothetical protein MYP_3306 [Sporocytophaga myxococcoides]|uniref:Uncharacterized protein n=1 Tax=Sporocytophaga myxococcoides TaxID=153721 RepID=A0A098LI12_9BACT|nr:hypothetical protein MYP_3306 [Sporocytophaga myxococcoides]
MGMGMCADAEIGRLEDRLYGFENNFSGCTGHRVCPGNCLNCDFCDLKDGL